MYNLLEIYNNPWKFEGFLLTPGYLIYRIHNKITDKSYIGDTEWNLYNRLFTGWFGGHFGRYESGYKAHLYNSMRKYGLEAFEIEILESSETLTEEYYIDFYDSYNKGYNQNKTGKGIGDCNSRMIWINNGKESKLIYPENLEEYLSQDWHKGRITLWLEGTKWMNFEGERIRVPESDIESYLKEGWILGTGISPVGSEGKCWVNDGTYEWMTPVDTPLENGVTYGRITKGTEGLFAVTDGKRTRFVTQEMYEELSDEWEVGTSGHSVLGRIYINDGECNYTIYPEELEGYLKEGYSLGRLSSSTKGRRAVVNENGEIHMVKPEDLQLYKENGYWLGTDWDTAREIIIPNDQ